MKNLNYKKVKGYIEGYYGKLLTWNERIELLDVLYKNNMNFYFYCPKEDINHRFKWKEQYNIEWLKNFSKFNKLCPLLNNGTVTLAVTEYESVLSTVLDGSSDFPTEPDKENSGAKFKLFFLTSNFEFISCNFNFL